MKNQIIFGTSVLSNDVPVIDDPWISFPGKSLTGKTCFNVDQGLLSKHILLLGGSGCGKTNAFFYALEAIRRQMTNKDVAIIFDTKGEFYELYSRPGDYLIGNSAKFRTISNTWNIFDEILIDGDDEINITMNAREIAEALFHDRGSESQPFFCNAARDIFRGILIHFIRCAKINPDKWRPLLNNECLIECFKEFTVTDYIEVFSKYDDMKSLLSYFGDGKSNQALGVFGELNSMISEYFVGILAQHSEERAISMRRAVRDRMGRAIFVEYDLSVGETLAPVYRLLVDQALKEALGRNASGSHIDGNVFLVADEFKLLPKLQHIDDALNFGRGLGVRVMAGIQSIDQLYDIYGEKKGAVIASGFGSIFAFHTNDGSSRDYITKRFGSNIMAYEYNNLSKNSVINNEREGNTVEEWEQIELALGQAVIGLGYNPPFLFQFDKYGN